ncbi:DNA polymerase V [Fusarium beomiforme]|uniref:DNA polymerase V n=1 Tax=Fusarium beomiforme TaxID=44412 RepID=A0A9P5AE96_9HYPO|nr:DNA polymerase V [Fusarium beomiforme]
MPKRKHTDDGSDLSVLASVGESQQDNKRDNRREARLYELLGDEDPTERYRAAEYLVPILLGVESDETVLRRHLDHRLFRGLASGRNASRLGFSLLLAEVLGQLFGEENLVESKYPGITFGGVLQMLTERTKATGNTSGQEEKDILFGRLFGLLAFIESGILFSDISRWNSVLKLILDLSSKKSWMQPLCTYNILQATKKMSQQQALETVKQLEQAHLAKTPEGVAIWLSTQTQFSGLKIEPWQIPLHKKTFGDLAAILRESFKDTGMDELEHNQQSKLAGWNPILHPVWSVILEYFLSKGQAGVGEFDQFWLRVVDDSLFSKRATDGQKFRGFQVFQKMLEAFVDLPAHVEALFSKNFTLCLMNQASQKHRYLNRAAIKALKAIELTTSRHPLTLLPILKGLLGQNGAYNFDQKTNTKTVDRILQNVSEETGEEIIKIIRKPFGTIAKLDTQKASSILRTYVDYLSKILNASASPTSGKIHQTVFSAALQELSQLAYSQPKNIPADTLTEGVRELCRTRLESSLAKISRRTEDYGSLCLAVSSIDPDSVPMSEEIKTAVQEALTRMQKLLKRKAVDDKEKSLFQSLAILHAVSIFQLYNEDPDAMEVLNDLAECSDRLKKGKSDEIEAGTSEILIEILLSMVARPSSLMRQVTQQVFDAFTPEISAEGLELLTGPLSSSESTKGQKELFSTGEDEIEVDEDEEGTDADEENTSDLEIDSDVEFVDIDEANNESGDEEEEEEDEDDGNDEGKNKGEFDKPEDLDNALENILKSHRLDKDIDAESSESEGDMSDSEMFAIDEQLAAAIKPRIQDRTNDSKKQKKEARQSVLNFKNRILDLLDIFVRNEARNPLSFTLLLPLLNLMRTTSTKPLATRAGNIISNYKKGLKKARNNRLEIHIPKPEDLLDLLREIHEAAGQDNSHAYAKAASAASLIVVSALYAADKSRLDDVHAVYSKTISADWRDEIKVQQSFFADWKNWLKNAT